MKIKLTKEERELEQYFNRGEWKSIPNKEQVIKKLKAAAKNTLVKDKRMNIRIAGKDIHLLKAKALEFEIPYQTLFSSI